MASFFSELKRRNVLRVAGLYVGIGFMLIEAGSILLPLFGFDDNLFKVWVFVVVAGFPLALASSWFFEITTEGILTDEEAQVQRAKPILGRRKGDYVVGAVLGVALLSSLTLNFVNFQDAPRTERPMSAVSLLIAEFNNATNEPLFTGTIEEALQIGLEGASFIAAYPRTDALSIARTMNPQISKLDADAARLVSVREGVNLVLSGDTHPDGSGYRISVVALDPSTGETVLESSVVAASKLEVLSAISDLASDVREHLGDLEVSAKHYTAETLSASNIEAVSAFLSAQAQASERHWQQAVVHYQRAVELDPNLGRAYSGWALAAAELGQAKQAEELWQTTLGLLDTMSTRERFRTLGLYYAVAKQDYDKAVDAYRELVTSFPADTAGYNNLAVASFLTLDFAAAQRAGQQALDLFPKSVLFRTNYALYSLYAGSFKDAVTAANAVLEERPDYAVANLPAFVAAALDHDFASARGAAEAMQQGDASLANLSLADLALYNGRFTDAATLLQQGVAADLGAGNQANAMTKRFMLAGLLADQGDAAATVELVRQGLEQASATTQLMQAALPLVQLQQHELLADIQRRLATKIQRQPRAYALGLQAVVAIQQGRVIEGIDLLRKGLDLADLWWLRQQLGKAYLLRGDTVEALSEFEIVERRVAEGAVMFLDDKPTLHQVVALPMLLAETQRALGMRRNAQANDRSFVASQAGQGRLAEVAAAQSRLSEG